MIFIGDTRLNDGTAFDNLCRAGGWPGLAFIGSESSKPAATEVTYSSGGQAIFLSNRWAALTDDSRAGFEFYRESHGFPVDADTAVVVDLDKTALGRAAATPRSSIWPACRQCAIRWLIYSARISIHLPLNPPTCS